MNKQFKATVYQLEGDRGWKQFKATRVHYPMYPSGAVEIEEYLTNKTIMIQGIWRVEPE